MKEPKKPLDQVMDAYRDAVWAKDVDAFAALYEQDVRTFDLWGKWSCDGVETVRAMAAGWFGSLGTDRVVVKWDDVRMSITNEVAVLHAFFTYTGVSAAGAELRAMSNRLTWVLTQTGGAWKIVHEHTSAPIDPTTIKAILKR